MPALGWYIGVVAAAPTIGTLLLLPSRDDTGRTTVGIACGLTGCTVGARGNF